MARKKNPEEFEDDDGDFGEEPNFEDPDDFVDDIPDEVTVNNNNNTNEEYLPKI